MNARQSALALSALLLTAETVPVASQPSSSAPALPADDQPALAPSVGNAHKLVSTYFLDQHSDGRPLAVNGYTSVATFKKVKCLNANGCTIGFDSMVQVLCRDTGSAAYVVDFYLVSEVNNVYGVVAPVQTAPHGYAVFSNKSATTGYRAYTGPFSFQNYQGVANGTTNSGSLQVKMVWAGGTDTPDCVLGDWTVSIPVYSP
jgi:hypothetical protein